MSLTHRKKTNPYHASNRKLLNNQKSNKLSTISLVDNTACCIIPPESVWHQIDSIRSKHDKSFGKWSAHMNLFFPFVPESLFMEASKEIGKKLSNIQPFEVELKDITFHENSKYLFVVPSILNEQQGNPFLQVSTEIIKLYPQCREAITGKTTDANLLDWKPHLTLGQFPMDELETYRNEIQEKWKPIQFQVKEISFIARQNKDSSFKIRQYIELGN